MVGGLLFISVCNWGVGVYYMVGMVMGKVFVMIVYNVWNGVGVWLVEVGVVWWLFLVWVIGVSYMYMKGNDMFDNVYVY